MTGTMSDRELRTGLSDLLDHIDSPAVISDEQIAALVAGALPEAERAGVIAAVAARPELARLTGLLLEGEPDPLKGGTADGAVLHDPSANPGRASAGRRRARRTRIWSGALGLTASLSLVLLTWTVVSPRLSPNGPSPSPLQTLSGYPRPGNGAPDYWAQLDDEERARELARQFVRDWALYASVACTAVLAIVVAVQSLRRPVIVTTAGPESAPGNR